MAAQTILVPYTSTEHEEARWYDGIAAWVLLAILLAVIAAGTY